MHAEIFGHSENSNIFGKLNTPRFANLTTDRVKPSQAPFLNPELPRSEEKSREFLLDLTESKIKPKI